MTDGSSEITVTLNGEHRRFASGTSLRGMIDVLGWKGRTLAVEVNQEVVRKDRHDETELREGDAIEVVSFVGGG